MLVVRHATLPDGRTDIDLVLDAERIVARTPPATATLALPDRPSTVDWTLRR
ncbi:MAG: hypothetical protein JSR59_24635 [Proteobacteria bacterium]|nr:hypothetical protein [Pseudomonadota bacterium]